MARLSSALLVGALLGLCPALSHAQGAAPKAEVEEYRLGAEDVVRVQAWGRADLSIEAAVDDGGRLSLPLVGNVDAAGRTSLDLGRYLTGRYQLIDPKITEVLVTVIQYNSMSVTVVGEVRNPGQHGFRAIPDLWKVLLTAGGMTPAADLARVQIVRYKETKAEDRIVTVDLSKGIERTPTETLPVLRPKDTVVVPSLTENVATGDRFNILGAVRAPGSYKVQSASTLLEALSLAGGELPSADLSKARLTRQSGNETVSYTLDLESYLREGRPRADLRLRPGDTISIPQKASGFSGVMEGISRFVPVISLAASVVSLLVATR